MTPERWSRIKELFAAASDLPPSGRAEFLAGATAGDPGLIVEVQSLLKAHEQPGGFLDSVSPELRNEAFTSPGASNRIGERIGAYRIVGVLGTGGMGDVFKAVRDDDQYRAEVAIKLMRADVSGNLIEQRFRTERQILAGLDHRNIARLLDGGTSGGGTPYVVMELVVGEPIDRYCDSLSLPPRERVQLFLQVCAAVSYAHQHLVVHRDLKPNNILVTTDGSVKLLDFGIAKLIESSADTAAPDNPETLTSMRAMTLDYASPEQLSGGTVTTVSDVYSLGVVLYRLLTGKSPYGARSTDAQRIAEILSDTVPTRPSLVRALDGDLDNILLMALRKEPQRRYGSVEQFANDLRNYLSGLPVVARGNALGYRMGKFLRRRKVEIAAAFLVLVSLVGGLGIAIHEGRVAQRHFDSVRKMANTLLFELHDEVAKLPGATKAREMLVKTSLEYLDTLFQESDSDRALQEELGVAYTKVGDIQGSELGANTGDTRGALVSYSKALALLEPLHRADPGNHRIAMQLARTYLQQGRVILLTSGGKNALLPVQKAVGLSEAALDAITDEADRMIQLGNSYSALADVQGSLGNTSAAMAALDKLVFVCETYARAHPDDERAYVALTGAYNNSAIVSDPNMPRPEAYQRAVTLLRRALAADEKLVALKPDKASYQWSLAETRFNLADLYYLDHEYPAALELFQLAAPVLAARAADPNDARARLLSMMADTNVAKTLLKVGRLDEADALFIKTEKVLLELASKNDNLRIDYALAQIGIRRGELYAQRAANPKLSRSAQLMYWHQSRDSLAQGLALAQKVNASYPLTGVNHEIIDAGIAGLAKAEAALK